MDHKRSYAIAIMLWSIRRASSRNVDEALQLAKPRLDKLLSESDRIVSLQLERSKCSVAKVIRR